MTGDNPISFKNKSYAKKKKKKKSLLIVNEAKQ